MNRYKSVLPLTLCVALAITACSSAEDDWAKATAANTVSAYQSFLDKHPNDPHRNEATAYVLQLEDDEDWKVAQSASTVASYQKYLQSDPRGTHAQDARSQLAALERADAWKIAQSAGSEAALKAFLRKYPRGTEADQAQKALEALNTDYRASLGTFTNEVAARKKRAEMQARFPQLLREVDVLVPDSSNRHYRVTSGLMDSRHADSICTSLRRDHQDCEVIRTDEIRS